MGNVRLRPVTIQPKRDKKSLDQQQFIWTDFDENFYWNSTSFPYKVVQTSTSLIWPQTDSMFYSIDSSANNQSMMTMPNNWISPVVVRRSIYLTMDHQIENELPQHRRQSNGKTSRTRKSHLSADEENRLIHHRSQKSNEHSSRQSTRTH